jgi:hypothetical protein
MPVSAISHYRGGTLASVAPLARKMKEVVLRNGALDYQVSRFQTGQSVGEWLVIVRYADWTAYARAQDSFARDPEHSSIVAEVSQVVQIISRELVGDLDL